MANSESLRFSALLVRLAEVETGTLTEAELRRAYVDDVHLLLREVVRLRRHHETCRQPGIRYFETKGGQFKRHNP